MLILYKARYLYSISACIAFSRPYTSHDIFHQSRLPVLPVCSGSLVACTKAKHNIVWSWLHLGSYKGHKPQLPLIPETPKWLVMVIVICIDKFKQLMCLCDPLTEYYSGAHIFGHSEWNHPVHKADVDSSTARESWRKTCLNHQPELWVLLA